MAGQTQRTRLVEWADLVGESLPEAVGENPDGNPETVDREAFEAADAWIDRTDADPE